MFFLADILRANDDLARVIKDYRRVLGVPGEPKKDIPTSTSSTAQSSADMVNTSQNSSNLSSLIDLDIGGNTSSVQSSLSANGDMLSNDLQSLGRLTFSRI